ncbi:MAG: DUF2235 domain-containing protein [Frankiaceae bacterium]
MRQLIVCCDGTWCTPEQPSVSNVKRLFDALADKDGENNDQLRHYAPGVGTEGDILARLRGGATAFDLDGKILGAYHWLITNYQPGDRIALFGFSRGAYTVRSLAGMIAACGLIDTTKLDAKQTGHRIVQVYRERYQTGSNDDRRWREGLTFSYDPDNAEQIPIHFIGVWDTVGALGIPNNLSWFDPLNPSAPNTFHDVTLNPNVPHARHAIATDERRRPFTPTLWSEPAPGQDVQQRWFPGSHMDVGGGHLERGLSDGALEWMIDEAADAAQLAFHKTTLGQVRPDPLDLLHDDNNILLAPAHQLQPLLEARFASLTQFVWDMRPRAVPIVDSKASRNELDKSVYERQEKVPITSGPYRPTRVLMPRESAEVEVLAAEPWNDTGLYLHAGDYTFTAVGEWLDHDIWSGPDGSASAHVLNGGALVRTLVGGAVSATANLYRRATGQKEASFPMERRIKDLPWMSLVGIVANDAVVVNGEKAHERIAICDRQTHSVVKDGYFYAFANDAWGFYSNNHGSVRLTVTRVS